MKQRVFCIGWHKTGTTSLGDALLVLGYRVLGCRLDLAHSLLHGDQGPALELARQYEAFQDVPWAALFKELDRAFPGSKFILTRRDENSWLNSAVQHFGDLDVPLHRWLYGKGVIRGNEALYLERYRQHYREVASYFAARPGDLLVMDLAAGDGWEKLCPFLNQPVPRKKFPHSNKGKHNLTLGEKVKEGVKNLIPMPLRQFRLRLLRWMGVPDPRYRFGNRSQNEQEGAAITQGAKQKRTA